VAVLLDTPSTSTQDFGIPYQPVPKKIVQTISPTEPCIGLWEGPLNLTGHWRRYQVLFVVRGDEKAAWLYDMGPLQIDEPMALRIPGFVDRGNGRYDVVETVERLRHMADAIRGDRHEAPEPMDLVGAFQRAMEEYNYRIHNISTFGAQGSTIRSSQ